MGTEMFFFTSALLCIQNRLYKINSFFNQSNDLFTTELKISEYICTRGYQKVRRLSL